MADISIPQAEADDLIAMPKYHQGRDAFQFPGGGEKKTLDFESEDGAERFKVDVYRGSIDFRKRSHHSRARRAIPLVRLDLNSSPHENPDGERVGRTHLHVYREDHGDAWAYELDDDRLPLRCRFHDLDNPSRTLEDFLRCCNVQDPPVISDGLAL